MPGNLSAIIVPLNVDFNDLSLDQLRCRRSVKWRRFPPDVLPAFVAEMDFPVAPPVAQAVQASLSRGGDFGYPQELVVPELADAFAEFARRRYGWEVQPERTFVLPDVMRGIELWINGFTSRGDGVVVNTPVYYPFLDAILGAGRHVVEAPFIQSPAGWDLDLEVLEDAFRRGNHLYLLCNPHNPLGRVLTRGELAAIAELAERYDVRVVADEIHAPLVYEGVRHTPFSSLDDCVAARTISLHAAGKAWNFPGLNCAVAVLRSPADIQYISNLPSRIRGAPSILGIDVSVAAYTQGESWLDALLKHLDGNRRALASLLAEHLPMVGYLQPEGTYLAWLDCRLLEDGDNAAQLFLDRGRVALNDGARFGTPGRGFVRLNFATSQALLTNAVERMRSAVVPEQ
jgi:cystathionine beta-lyase